MKTTKIVEADIGKRALAAVMDLFFAFLLGTAIFAGFSVGLTSSEAGKQTMENVISYQVGSGLYYRDTDGNVKYYDNLVSYDLYEQKIHDYYTVYLTQEVEAQYRTNYDTYWFNVFVLGLDDVKGIYTAEELANRKEPGASTKGLFDYPVEEGIAQYDKMGVPHSSLYDDNGQLRDTSKQWLLEFFYTPNRINAYYNAAGDLNNREFFAEALYQYDRRSTLIPLLIAVPIAAVSFYIVVPLIFRDGRTFGKMIMKLSVIRQDEYKTNRLQIALRQVPSVIVVIVLFAFFSWLNAALISLGMLIISYLLAIFTPKHRAIHDFLAYTRVVNDRDSFFYRKGEIEQEQLEEKKEIVPPEE